MNEPNRIEGRDHYERPNARWVCGNVHTGCPCHLGPDPRGRCQASFECTPVRRGDRWSCTRSSVAGGACQAGPLPDGTCCRPASPCVPVRTMLGRRRVFVNACTLLTLGFLMLGISGPRRAQFLSSGKLTSHHASLTDSQSCEACHAAAHEGAGGWIRRILKPGEKASDVGAVQSEKCLSCHADLFDEPWQHVAHNVDPERLASRTAAAGQHAFRFRELFGGSVHNQSSLACAMCHREHHGRDHDLEAITNRQCQSCHAETFASLATGHPDFGDWPYRRRSRIAFNHLAHETQHFPKEAEAFDCSRCHVDDATQTVKLLAGFDQACSSCHQASIRESFAGGIPLLSLPALDRSVLQIFNRDVPEWPTTASDFFDGTIPPLMQLLLAADEQAVIAMEVLAPTLDFSLIDESDPRQIHAAADLAEAIQRLMDALQGNGMEEIQRRVSVVLQREVGEEEISVLTRRTPPALLAAVAQAWFPSAEAPDLSLYLHQPLTTDNSQEPQTAARQSNFNQPSFSSSSARLPARRASFGRQDESEWLAENPLREWLEAELKSQQQPAQEPPDEQLVDPGNLPERSELAGNETNDSETDPKDELSSDAVESSREVEVVTREVVKLLPSGDWVYDDLTMKLSYAPAGHADAMLKELLDLIGQTPIEGRSPIVQRVVERLTEDTAPGRCASCHTIDERELTVRDSSTGLGSLHSWYVNWNGKSRSAKERSFTRFVHRPHLVQPETQDCTACHALDRGYVFDESQRELNPRVFHSEFLPLRKGTCASCHQPQGASERCTTCHNYHVQSHSAGSR